MNRIVMAIAIVVMVSIFAVSGYAQAAALGSKIVESQYQSDGEKAVLDASKIDESLLTLLEGTEAVPAVESKETFSSTTNGKEEGNPQHVLRGRVFNDVHELGIPGWELPGLRNWGVHISGPVNMVVQTDENGFFYAQVPQGTYTICEDSPLRGIQTYPHTGYSCPNGTIGYEVEMYYEEGISLIEFGNFFYGHVHGYKWDDVDGDGEWDDNEKVLAGWTMTAWGPNGDYQTTQTNQYGHYVFTMLHAGDYNIGEQMLTGWSQTYPGGDEVYYLTIESSDKYTDIDFGNKYTGVVTRTQEFWKNHTEFTGMILDEYMGSGFPIGNSSHQRMITNDWGDGNSTLFGAYFARIPRKLTGEIRNEVDQWRITLLHQLVTAKLNCAAFGCPIRAQLVINTANEAYANGDINTMRKAKNTLDSYNNSGDDRNIPTYLGLPGSATPYLSQGRANIAYWDFP